MQEHPILTPLQTQLNALAEALIDAHLNPEWIKVPDRIFDLAADVEEANDALRKAIVAHLNKKD